MTKVKVGAFSISLDGFGAGPRQDINNPLGVRGLELHHWFFETAVFKKIHGQAADMEKTDGSEGFDFHKIDNDIAAQSFENVGAWILGRNMFGPVRGPWDASPENAEWKGWWDDNPPYHTPVFVLTHHARKPLVMDGGTTFYFVTDGVHSALQQAQAAMGNTNKDVRIGGGVSIIRQFLAAGLIDEMHLAMSPVLLGEGEHLFHGMNLHDLGFTSVRTVAGEGATHVFLTKK